MRTADIKIDCPNFGANSKVESACWVNSARVLWFKLKQDSEVIIRDTVIAMIPRQTIVGNTENYDPVTDASKIQYSFTRHNAQCLTDAQNGAISLTNGQNSPVIGGLFGAGETCAYYSNLKEFTNLEYPFSGDEATCE